MWWGTQCRSDPQTFVALAAGVILHSSTEELLAAQVNPIEQRRVAEDDASLGANTIQRFCRRAEKLRELNVSGDHTDSVRGDAGGRVQCGCSPFYFR